MFGGFNRFIKREEGLGTVEIVVIIAILVGIALIFRNAIIDFVTSIMKGVFNSDVTTQINSTGIQGQHPIK